MKVCVTGSQGFIGSYLCQELLECGYEVVGVDNYSKYGFVNRPHDNQQHFSFYKLDIAKDYEEFERITKKEKPDVVVALAAMIGGINYFHRYAYDLLACNERILANTFDISLDLFRKGILKKIVVISSSMVFERATLYPTPESHLDECRIPLSTYGFQKLASEYFCKGAYEQWKLPYTIARPFNCVGVGEERAVVDENNTKLLMSHVLPDLVFKALHLERGGALPLLGDGSQVRHYTNGRDVARGIRLCIEDTNLNMDYNISSPVATTVKELGIMVWKQVHDAEVEFIFTEQPYRHDVQFRSPDVSKAERYLGFRADIPLSQSVQEVTNWMRLRYG
jgi:UDP-glucose 4-epimerase